MEIGYSVDFESQNEADTDDHGGCVTMAQRAVVRSKSGLCQNDWANRD